MNKTTGLPRIVKAMGHAIQGVKVIWRYEAAFRQEFGLLMVTILLAIWLDVSLVERILLIGSVALILLLEIINSAIEAVVDRISLEHHELSGRAKDMAAAAVFLAFWLAAFVWISIIWSHLSVIK